MHTIFKTDNYLNLPAQMLRGLQLLQMHFPKMLKGITATIPGLLNPPGFTRMNLLDCTTRVPHHLHDEGIQIHTQCARDKRLHFTAKAEEVGDFFR